MFLVQRVGPTSFVVREDGRRRACKVLIGAKMTCGCGGGFGGSNTNRRVGSNSARAGSGLSATTSATRLAIMEAAGIRTDADDAATVHATRDLPEVCAHIVFVMRKVLGVPRSNPLTWQVSLIDRELDEVLRCEPRAVAFAVDAGRRRGERSTDASGGGVGDASDARERGRRALEADEACPICYEPMRAAASASSSKRDFDHGDDLLWCERGCGRNVHARCLSLYAQHQVRSIHWFPYDRVGVVNADP